MRHNNVLFLFSALLIALLGLSLIQSASAQPPPTSAGMYIEITSDFITTVVEQAIIDMEKIAINVTAGIDISGKKDGAEYHAFDFTFESFDMLPLVVSAGSNSGLGQLTFKTTFSQEKSFELAFKLHIKFGLLKSEFEIKAFNEGPGGLEISLTPDLTSHNYPILSSSSEWWWDSKHKEFKVDTKCLTNPLCTVPILVVEQVAKNIFIDTMHKIPSAINSVIKNKVDPILKDISLIPQYAGVELDLHGAMVFEGANPHTDVVLQLSGDFTPVNAPGPIPFTVPGVPSILANPPGQIGVVVQDYVVETFLWSMEMDGKLKLEVGPNNLPEGIASQLNTNNPEMRLIASGLKNYPDMNISIDISIVNTSNAIIDFTQGGLDISGLVILLDFKLENETVSNLEAFTIAVDTILMMDINVTSSGAEINLLSGRKQSSFDFSTVDSKVGRVSVTLLQTTVMNIFRVLAANPIKIPFTFPSFLDTPEVIFSPGYVSFYTNLAVKSDGAVRAGQKKIASEFGEIIDRAVADAVAENAVPGGNLDRFLDLIAQLS